MNPTRSFFLALSRSQRLKVMTASFGPARSMARRFVAGETRAEALAAVRSLNQQGILATLDHLGENVSGEAEAEHATLEVLDLLEAIEDHALRSGVSIKLTQLGQDLSPELAAKNVDRIVAHAARFHRFVRIDMESSAYVQSTLDLYEELRGRYQNVGVVIQAYLYRSEDDVARLVDLGASVRLVKGAYDEPPEVAYPAKADTDASFARLMEILLSDRALERGSFVALATHDTALINQARALTSRRGIDPDRFEFQMLYGIRLGLQRQLVSYGYRVRAYVPYGEQWYPYFVRRLAERPANLLFLLRNLLRS